MIEISTKPKENGAAIFTIGPFTDENGDTITPSAIRWTLITPNGMVINNRERVSATPGTSVTVLLEGDDLQVGAYGIERVFLVRALYNSTLGSNIPLIEQVKFTIECTPVAA